MSAFSFILHLFLLLASPTACVKPSAPKPLGFSATLIHRDSPLSPLYDPLSTPTQRAEQAVRRSRRRSQHLASAFANSKMVVSPVPDSAEYLIQLSIGTPSRDYWLTMDTGTDITWVACRPCDTCFVHQDLLFEPEQSSSYGSQSCPSQNCTLAGGICDDDDQCLFGVGYADKSRILGRLSSEAISFDNGGRQKMSFSGIIFGCVHHEEAPQPHLLEGPGIIGLGQGPVSLVSQIGPTIEQKFAYCLPPVTGRNNGWLKFGSDADEYFGEHELQVVSLGQPGRQVTHYMVILEDISVGNDPVNIQWRPPQLPDEDARCLVVDSGSILMYLAPYVYDQVKEAVEEAVDGASFIDDGRLCYHVDEENPYRGLPEMTLHFYGADWKLPPPHVFTVVEGTGAACLAIGAESDGEVGILGSLAQQNMFIKFDLGNGLLSFAPTDNCGEI